MAMSGPAIYQGCRTPSDLSIFTASSSEPWLSPSASAREYYEGLRTPDWLEQSPESTHTQIVVGGERNAGNARLLQIKMFLMKAILGRSVFDLKPSFPEAASSSSSAAPLAAAASSSSTFPSLIDRVLDLGAQGACKFTLSEIYRATKNFSPKYKIGQGGFGTVYKGRLEDGMYVAVKRAKKALYDQHLSVEFQSEVQTLAHIEHLSVVKFLGYLEDKDERIIVVEYVPNGTLREHLDVLHGTVLDLASRLDIAIDVAHAVTYLHMYTDRVIIHRDIKSSNILLTENFRAKVADFGFAHSAETDTDTANNLTEVKGTAGYLDPEYLRTYQLTEKSDVYSFGVLLVELVSGRRPIEPKKKMKERITARWAMKYYAEGNDIQVLDPKLPRNPATNLALEKILELALQCLAPTRQNRPGMKRCAEILWCIRKEYRELSAMDVQSLSSGSQRNASIREV